MIWTDIEPGKDAVFLPGKIHGCVDECYILYVNECANDGNGSIEIEIVDAERILILNERVHGNAKEFFDELPDWFNGEWYYCDNCPGDEFNSFQEYVDGWNDADFIVGRDGGIDEELKFLVEWANKVYEEITV